MHAGPSFAPSSESRRQYPDGDGCGAESAAAAVAKPLATPCRERRCAACRRSSNRARLLSSRPLGMPGSCDDAAGGAERVCCEHRRLAHMRRRACCATRRAVIASLVAYQTPEPDTECQQAASKFWQHMLSKILVEQDTDSLSGCLLGSQKLQLCISKLSAKISCYR